MFLYNYPQNLCFLLKMSAHSTSYDNWFRIHGDSKKYPKFHQLFMKMTSSLPLYEKMWMSHKLRYIRNTSMAKLEKNLLCWKFARWSMFSGRYPPHYCGDFSILTRENKIFLLEVKESLFNLVPSALFCYKKKAKKRHWNALDTWLKFAQIEGIFFRIN